MDETTQAEKQEAENHRHFKLAIFIGLIYALGDFQGHIGHGVALEHHLLSFAASWGLITIISDLVLDIVLQKNAQK